MRKKSSKRKLYPKILTFERRLPKAGRQPVAGFSEGGGGGDFPPDFPHGVVGCFVQLYKFRNERAHRILYDHDIAHRQRFHNPQPTKNKS